MNTSQRLETGTPLEARIQRLFMCQGAFAERGLYMRAIRGDAKMATDIDIVAHDYSINFHHTRIYAECKGGKNRSPLDRAIWIRGVREALGADFAYLVLDQCDSSTATFARSIGVEILQRAGLETLESALSIDPLFWPGRTNLHAYGHCDQSIRDILKKRLTGDWLTDWIAQSAETWRESTALSFSYGRLNGLLRMLMETRRVVDSGGFRPDDFPIVNYVVAAMLVRLSQYVLFVAADTIALTPTERLQYLALRFTSGNMEPEQARKILQSALRMLEVKLRENNIEPPAGWTVDHLMAPASYTSPFNELIGRAMGEGDKTRVLPLAMEMRLFGYGGPEKGCERLLERVRQAQDVTSNVTAFARQALEVPPALIREPAHSFPGAKPINGTPKNPQAELPLKPPF
jgi:hypothetical protein